MHTVETPPAGQPGGLSDHGGNGSDLSVSDGTDTVQTFDRVSAALNYAAQGWPVFPCRPHAKRPLTEHGLHNATTDPSIIRAWWARTPTANVAIATGTPAIDVIDVDVKNGIDGHSALEKLRTAGLLRGAIATVRTPSGGLHIYYRGTRQRNGSIARFGIDFRSAGGYVLAPPSYVADADKRYAGSYSVLSVRQGARGQAVDWEACKRLLVPRAPRRNVVTSRTRDGAALARWVASQPAGNRNAGLYWAARRALESGDISLEPLVDAAVSAGLSDSEARRTVGSAERAGGGS